MSFCGGAKGYAWYENGQLADHFPPRTRSVHSFSLLGDLWLAIGQ